MRICPIVPALALTCAVGFAGDRQPDPPASVLLITLDTTRADHLGCYGSTDAATPELDAIARGGVRFEHVTAPAPLTVPSHASLMTGLVPRRHGARDNAGFPLPREVTTLSEHMGARGYATAAVVGSFVLDRGAGLARGFDRYDDDVRVGARAEFAYEERSARAVTDAAADVVTTLEPPFLLWAHYFDAHAPYVPPPPKRGYAGEIAFVDEQVGRLVKLARARTARLLVVVVGDHGESLGEHGEATHGLLLYEATQHVPWMMSGPGIARGRVVPTRVGLIDVAPTLLDLLGIEAIADTDGRSVVALLDGANRSTSDVAYEMETLYPFLSYGWSPLHALVEGNWKYIEAPRRELYDLGVDAAEGRNRLEDATDRATRMARDLADRLAADTVNAARANGPEAAERRRRLESLGYVAGGSTRRSEEAIDPKDGIRWLEHLDRARRRAAAGDPRGCADAVRPLLAKNPDNVPALLTLASCRLAFGDANGALSATDAAESVRPGDDLVAFHRANALAALVSTGEASRERAVAAYERAVERNPRRADTWLNYATFVASAVGPREALTVLERASSAGVRGPDLEVTRGINLLRTGQAEAAEESFRWAVERNPADTEALRALARLAQKRNDPAGAAAWLGRLLELQPSWDVAVALGAAHQAAGNGPDAVTAWSRALDLLPPEHPKRSDIERDIARVSHDGTSGGDRP